MSLLLKSVLIKSCKSFLITNQIVRQNKRDKLQTAYINERLRLLVPLE